MSKKYKLIIDSREKMKLDFDVCETVKAVEVAKLDTGDYCPDGLQDVFALDRKGCIEELANNLVTKRFDRELERMSDMKYRYIVCEFPYESVSNYPYSSKIPKSKLKSIRVRGPYLERLIIDKTVEYGVHFIFCKNRNHCQKIVLYLMNRAWQKENKV